MSQGVIEGVENPAVVLFGGKFYEVAKNLNLTAHTKHISPFITGMQFWNGLSQTEKEILTRTSRQMVKYDAQLIQSSEKKPLRI
ncbi:hypothetical protein P4S72_21350 [Vibrio sp. PP-XX7]